MRNAHHAITSIYDSAIDENYWDIALDNSVELVGARSASLTVVESNPSMSNHLSRISRVFRNIDGEFMSFYNKNLIKYEKDGWDYVLSQPIHSLVTDKDVWREKDVDIVERDDFAFLLKHAGILRRVVARLNENRIWSDNIAFQFDKSMSVVPATNMESMQLLLPHMAKTIELGRAFSILQSQYKAVLTALDFVEIGICIALDNGTVIVANIESERIFDNDDGIRLDKNRYLRTSISLDVERTLRHAIAEVSVTASGNNSMSESILSVDRRSGKHPYLVEISPLRDASSELETGMSGAVIMIIDPDNSSVVRTDRLSLAYELTDAEAAVTQYLVDGWTNADIAEQRNVSIDTVKSQVASILQKTRTKRRSDIVRLALKASPPIKIFNS